MTGTEEAEAVLDEVLETAEKAEQGDLYTFIKRVDELAYTDENGTANIDALEEETLPFYEDERALAALLCLSAGTAIEAKYSEHRLDNAEPATQPDDSFQG